MSVFPLLGMPGATELLIIAGVIVLIFGAAKLPKLGKGLGEGIRNFKDGLKSNDKSDDEADSKPPKLDE
ncbi:MAG: twin-arginine translocase TatA/TatE family subunit [Deltaproteobacteria bacterium]|nr:twin-arginine translocase TatA/TatE family subunit [Deltaproteobacteria bacterium]